MESFLLAPRYDRQSILRIPPNRQSERKIQEIGRYLHTFCHGHHNSWNRFLARVEHAQNSSRQPSVVQCVLSYQPPLFPWSGESSEFPSITHWFQESERVWDSAHQHLHRAVKRHQHNAEVRRAPAPTFQPGQARYGSPLGTSGCASPVRSQYIGPFPVIRQIIPVTYELKLPSQYRIHPIFHVSLLKPNHSPVLSVSTEPGTTDDPPLPIVLEDGTTYSVREILSSRHRGGRLEYLVDWEGYGREGEIMGPRSRGRPP